MEAARAAAPAVLAHYRRGGEVTFKNDREPLTKADLASQEIISGTLGQAFPDDAFLYEEAADDDTRLGKERVWIVDPVDGTQEFVKGLLEFVIMIGLCIDTRPSLGVILQPGSGRLYIGLPGYGSFACRHGQVRQLNVSSRRELSEMAVVCSRSHLSPFMRECLDHLGFGRVVRMGSAGLKAALVAEQGADCYFFADLGMKEWDLCAPAAVLLGAGARLTTCWGDPIAFNQPDVVMPSGLVTTNGPRHDEVVETLTARCGALGLTRRDGFRSH